MEEELTYANVIFKSSGIPPKEREDEGKVIYLQVKPKQTAFEELSAEPENGKAAPHPSRLKLLATGLGILCVLLISTIIVLSMHFNAVITEQYSNYDKLTRRNQQLSSKQMDLERRIQELIREKDSLNWTIGVIMGFDDFPVHKLCPQKACKPCQEGWQLFGSSCYLFQELNYSSQWKGWEDSVEHCKEQNAHLVISDSQEEQEFINNHTAFYKDDAHGYWIGLRYHSRDSAWHWVDGNTLTTNFWMPEQLGYKGYGTLIIPGRDPSANWDPASWTMKNRWICETKSLIKS